MLVTDDDGASALRITADYVGEHTISVAFAGDEDNLPASVFTKLPRRRLSGGDRPPLQRLPRRGRAQA